MKVQTLRLENFKRFDLRELDFRNPETGLAEDLIVLVGQNGSGKSSVLQAIAALLGTATGRLSSPRELDWPGFDLRLANGAWVRPTEIELQVAFSPDEITATREYFGRTDLWRSGEIGPDERPVVKLWYNAVDDRATTRIPAEHAQFSGRRYARMILKSAQDGTRLLERVGDIFWYTEQRTTNSLAPAESNGQVITYDMDLLRRRMADWFNFHERLQRGERDLRPGERDIFADIERAYQTVFPGHRFDGPVPRASIEDILAEPWFYLFDGHHQYELAEMSGGERAIFPMIFDFANWNINNSVVLIDELELHLHPPLQQGLLRALQKLGKHNQFIITTHSDAVLSIVPENAIRRL